MIAWSVHYTINQPVT